MTEAAAEPARRARRELAVAAVLSAMGGALALYAAGRTWTVTETPRPSPLPAVRAAASGRDVVPWAAALAFVALAGGLALLATRKAVRTVLGVVLAVAGAGIVAGGVTGLLSAGEAYQHVQVHAAGPVPFAAGGLAVLVAGGLTVVRGRRWGAMGSKYDAPGAAPPPVEDRDVEDQGLWDALDRGEDPTAR